MNRLWMIRAGEGAYLIDDFIEKSIVSISWNELGDLKKLRDREQFKELIADTYEDYPQGKTNLVAGQLYKFSKEIKVGDNIITYDPSERIYHMGKVISGYYYKPSDYDHFHFLGVEWTDEISRDELSLVSRNYLGAAMSLFEVRGETYNELLNIEEDEDHEDIDDSAEEETPDIKNDTVLKAHEFIKDMVVKLDWEQMQELVAGILRAMGYKTKVSPKGPDRGKDIIASPDGLGLEDPRIIVEVKHRSGSIGADLIRSFTGGLRAGSKGIYVSVGGFTKEAKYEAERSNFHISLIDLDSLVELIVQYYDNFDIETRTLVPLVKIYWPLNVI